jgi:TonB family protein
MKVTVLAFLFSAMIASSAATQIATDRSEAEVRDNPQSIRTEVARFFEKSATMVEGPRILASELSYDSRGNLTRSVVYDLKGSLYAKYAATFDGRGNKTEEVYYDRKDSILDRMLYTYDGSDRLIQKEVVKAKHAPGAIIAYKYDSGGRISEKRRPDVKNSRGYDSTYSYNDPERSIELASYDLKGKLISKILEKYNSKGRMIEKQVTFPDGLQSWRSTLVYDAKGILSDEIVHVFDSQSRWRYTYEFDLKGNWVKRTRLSMVNDAGRVSYAPVEVAYRSITYNSPDTKHQASSPDLSAIVLKKETGSYLPADAIRRVQPVYPSEAKARRETGKVNVFVMVNEYGDVISARAAPGPSPYLREAAAGAASRWKFAPTLSGGMPVKYAGKTVFEFNL